MKILLYMLFVHTSKGHWNLCYVPFIGVSGEVELQDVLFQL